MLNWSEIDTVLLDMDGTLLDLHFDNHFWMEHTPVAYAQKNGMSVEQAKVLLKKRNDAVYGQLEWYCLDYWAQELDMDIVAAKREIEHLIAMRQDTIPFLDALRDSGRELVLVTNAHPDSLSLKIEHTQLDEHISTLISTHEFGVTKESQALWQKLHKRLNFDPKRTLFVDDSVPILQSAQTFGIGHLLCVKNPDSKKPLRQIDEFDAIEDYRTMINDILANPVKRV